MRRLIPHDIVIYDLGGPAVHLGIETSVFIRAVSPAAPAVVVEDEIPLELKQPYKR